MHTLSVRVPISLRPIPLRLGALLLSLFLFVQFASGQALAADFTSPRLGVTVEGDGPDVILIPGLSSSPEVWTSTIKGVPGYRYHRIHVSGFAGRPAGGNAEGLVSAPVAEEIARYISESGLRKPAVIGHSMGGTIAMMLAARHPDAVGKVMVVDMMPFMGAMFTAPGSSPEAVKATADQIRDGITNATAETHKATQEKTLDGMVNDPAGRVLAKQHGAASDRAVSARAMHELIVTDLRPELAKITAPTTVLYVHGPGYPITAEQLDGFYALSYAGVKGVKLKRIPDAAHFIMWDQPAAFQAEVKAFLGR